VPPGVLGRRHCTQCHQHAIGLQHKKKKTQGGRITHGDGAELTPVDSRGVHATTPSEIFRDWCSAYSTWRAHARANKPLGHARHGAAVEGGAGEGEPRGRATQARPARPGTDCVETPRTTAITSLAQTNQWLIMCRATRGSHGPRVHAGREQCSARRGTRHAQLGPE
jgi:hypothetical protein